MIYSKSHTGLAKKPVDVHPITFIENLMTIYDNPIKLFECQKTYIKAMHESSVIALQQRQQGVTTASMMYLLQEMLRKPTSIAVMVPSSQMIDYVRNIVNVLLEPFKEYVVSRNRYIISLSNGSNISFAVIDERNVIGRRCDILYLADMGFSQKSEDALYRVRPTQCGGTIGKVITHLDSSSPSLNLWLSSQFDWLLHIDLRP